MTAITSMKQLQPRRPGELGVHSVDHFNFVVPDLKQAASFYGSFGLDVREEGNSLGLYTFGHEHRWGRVNEGTAKKFTYLSFGCFPEDLAPLRARLQKAGVPELDPPRSPRPTKRQRNRTRPARPACRGRTPAPVRRSSSPAGLRIS